MQTKATDTKIDPKNVKPDDKQAKLAANAKTSQHAVAPSPVKAVDTHGVHKAEPMQKPGNHEAQATHGEGKHSSDKRPDQRAAEVNEATPVGFEKPTMADQKTRPAKI